MAVLIVAHNALLRLNVKRDLRRAGFGGTIVEAPDSVHALAAAASWRPDLIVCERTQSPQTTAALHDRLRSRGFSGRFEVTGLPADIEHLRALLEAVTA